MHIIHRVSVDAHNRIDTVEWQAADPKANAWVGAREVVPVIQVVDEIMSGGKVAMAVPHGPGNGPCRPRKPSPSPAMNGSMPLQQLKTLHRYTTFPGFDSEAAPIDDPGAA